jgi:hypothetical protein
MIIGNSEVSKMGNTKQIFFEGNVRHDDAENPFFGDDIEKRILHVAHGDHVVLKIERSGYLYLNHGDSFVIGSLTTHSCSGWEVIPFMTKYLHDYTIIARDAEWTDVKVIQDDDDGNSIQLVYDRVRENDKSLHDKRSDRGA